MALALARWRRELFRCQRHLVYNRGIVAQLEVKLATFGMGHGQYVPRKSIGHFNGVFELRVAGDGIHQEEIRAAQPALLIRSRWALQIVQLRQTDEGGQRLPIARRTVIDHAKLQRPEGRPTECLRRIQRGQCYFGVLQRHAAVVETQGR